jgi:NitT/TauT family transport system ATP-binding protein
MRTGKGKRSRSRWRETVIVIEQQFPLIRFDSVRMTFPASSGRTSIEVIKDIDLGINAGEFVSFIGPSGCGKSTLLTVIAGYLKPTSGQVLLNGRPVTGPGPERMMVFQQPALFPWLTAEGNVSYGLRLKKNRHEPRSAKEKVASILKQVQLDQFAAYYPSELSGGMRQRIEIARALAVNPEVLLMDEPLGALDSLTRRSMQREVLRIWAETQKTILFVTHDIDEAVIMSDRIVVMGPRPTVIREILTNTLPRPRLRDDPAVARLTRHLSELLEQEGL